MTRVDLGINQIADCVEIVMARQVAHDAVSDPVFAAAGTQKVANPCKACHSRVVQRTGCAADPSPDRLAADPHCRIDHRMLGHLAGVVEWNGALGAC